MLERSIRNAKLVSDCVIVSSDDLEMLEFAKMQGVHPLLRDKALSDDKTPTLPVIWHTLLPFISEEARDFLAKDSILKAGLEDSILKDVLKNDKNSKKLPESKNTKKANKNSYGDISNIPLQISLRSKVLCLYATAMFATEDVILESCFMLDKNPNASYIVSIIEASKVFRSFTCTDSGFLQFMFPQFMDTRSQDLPQAFFDAGQFYLGFAKSFLAKIPLLGQKSMGISLKYAHDIDSMLDLLVAESIFKHIN